MNTIKLGALALALSLAACSSGIKKADIAATANPSDEIARLESEIGQGFAAHYDVLTNKEFAKSQRYLQEAKADLASNQGQKEILGDIGYAQGYLNEARDKAATRAAQIPGIIEARQRALDAGARQFPPTRKGLGKVDDKVRGNAGNFNKLDADEFSTMQNAYLDLELSAVKNTQLGKAQAQVSGASKARSYAPKSLKRAEMDLKNANNMITANRNSNDSFADAVKQANHSAGLLTAVLAATQKGNVDEATAMNIVAQQRQIAGLEGQLDDAASSSSQMSATLAKQGQQLKDNKHAIDMQKSMETARKEFSKEEADVFQQGDRLLIRLKSMNFASGGSDLPEASLAVLAKVRTVAGDLGPKTITVEGHTDSTGSPQINQDLSQKRASAVASYLGSHGLDENSIRAVGYGFKKPIASNKSPVGRSQNRRVDIVITPGAPADSVQQ